MVILCGDERAVRVSANRRPQPKSRVPAIQARQDGFPKQHPVINPWTVPGPAGVVEATLPFTTYLVLIFHAGQRYPMGGGRSPLLVTDHTLSIPSPNK